MTTQRSIPETLVRVKELTRVGELEEAHALCVALTLQFPDVPRVWFRLGIVELKRKRPYEAEQALRRSLALAPQNADALNNLSVALGEQQNWVAAEQIAREAVALQEQHSVAWLSLGNAFFGQKRWEEASAAYRQALAIQPHDCAAWGNLGATEQKFGQLAVAQQAYERALQISPNDENANVNYGRLLAERGRLEESLRILLAITTRCPNNATAWAILGNIFKVSGNLSDAKLSYDRALRLVPAHVEAIFGLALVHFLQWRLAEAEALVRKLLRLSPDNADGLGLLSGIQQARMESEASIATMQRAVQIAPTADKGSKLLMARQYADDMSPSRLLDEHRQWNTEYAQQFAPTSVSHREKSDKDRPLRLGFVSSDFGHHPTGFMVLPGLDCLDKSKCTLAFYSDRSGEDDYTKRFQSIADLWRPTLGLTPEEMAHQIRNDDIDVLFDLTGHVGKRLLTFARKPAPVQVTWFGYVGTTGLSAMDFLLADRFHVRPGEEPFFAETVLRMPNGYACYAAPITTPDVGPLPAINNKTITFGCFNNPAKFGSSILNAWATILNRVPTAKFFLKFDGLDDEQARSRLFDRFAEHGVAPTRIIAEGRSSHSELLASYNRIDLALDTQPYSGGVTTCEGLWMGVPVITFAGQTFAGRHATSHLTNAGYPQFVAPDIDGYVNLAVEWASRIDELAAIRSQMRHQLRLSALCDAPRFAHDFLNVIQEAWEAKTQTIHN